ncbi:transcriptional regulator, TetR family [Geodermatophilus siccatus]|uniref:Transcriptional regulator, TetR family n=1 Tax=Geodermatophilus siccatus TaxID=1137991 RepID=A0A1G9VUH4_9ACTN|nr:TetR/AcrR family transcriptional regulator [Geodermatophilus siccatus]SDM75790.1 transcriptional regulator, TetR family [Geodermatophilus siccatus]
MVQRRRRLLDVETILDAALACIDERGRLTMADLAARLGASASSIYHHVSGRPEIVELLRERLVARLELPRLDRSEWGSQVAAYMRSYREALAEHPNLIPLLSEQTMTAGSVLLGYDRVAAVLGAAGFPEDQVMLWVSVLDSYALGAALDLAAPDEVWRAGGGDTPALEAALRAAPQGRARADAAFELGLEALLAGMRSRLPVGPV